MADHYQIYKDTTGQYRWRYQTTNTEIIADSAESYHKKSDCQRGIDIMKASSSSPVVDSTSSETASAKY